MIVQNIIRSGIVSAVNEQKQAIKVVFPDRDNQVSDWLPIIVPPIQMIDIQLPDVGDTVLCVFLGNGLETGYYLGKVGG